MKNALLILSLLFAGCAAAPAEPPRAPELRQPGVVQLHADRTSSTTVLLTLRNDSARAVGYNLCATMMERRSGSDWTVVPSDIACTLELRTIGPGGSTTFTRRVPATLPAGEYRFVTQVESPLGTRPEAITSNTITVS